MVRSPNSTRLLVKVRYDRITVPNIWVLLRTTSVLHPEFWGLWGRKDLPQQILKAFVTPCTTVLGSTCYGTDGSAQSGCRLIGWLIDWLLVAHEPTVQGSSRNHMIDVLEMKQHLSACGRKVKKNRKVEQTQNCWRGNEQATTTDQTECRPA